MLILCLSYFITTVPNKTHGTPFHELLWNDSIKKFMQVISNDIHNSISEWEPFEFKLEVQLKYRSKIKDYDILFKQTKKQAEEELKTENIKWAEANTPREHTKWFRGTYSRKKSMLYN